MADHIISLNNKQEHAAQLIVDNINTPPGASAPTGTLSVDEWMRELVVHPIRAKIAEIKAQNVLSVSDAYDAANTSVQAQVKSILGI